jgi:hypothetical protein
MTLNVSERRGFMTTQQADIYLRVITGMSLDDFTKKLITEHMEESRANDTTKSDIKQVEANGFSSD